MHKREWGIWLFSGLVFGVMAAILYWVKFRFLLIDHQYELYGLIIGSVFIIIGIWLGLKLSKPTTIIQTETIVHTETIVREVPVFRESAPDEYHVRRTQQQLGISEREREVLVFLVKGLSNQEIAAQLFVSQNTVKTHLSNLYFKLDVKRRTQAVEKARQLGIV